jgi:hypothetical protein
MSSQFRLYTSLDSPIIDQLSYNPHYVVLHLGIDFADRHSEHGCEQKTEQLCRI